MPHYVILPEWDGQLLITSDFLDPGDQILPPGEENNHLSFCNLVAILLYKNTVFNCVKNNAVCFSDPETILYLTEISRAASWRKN